MPKKKPERRYKLDLAETQAKTIVQALDFWVRMGIGQFNEIENGARWGLFAERNDKGKPVGPEIGSYPWGPTEGYDLLKLRNSAFPSLKESGFSASMGVYNPSVGEVFREALDVHDVVRNKVAWSNNPKGGMTVDFDPPRKSSALELPAISSYTTPKSLNHGDEVEELKGCPVGLGVDGNLIRSGDKVVCILRPEGTKKRKTHVAYMEAYAYLDKVDGSVCFGLRWLERDNIAYLSYSGVILAPDHASAPFLLPPPSDCCKCPDSSAKSLKKCVVALEKGLLVTLDLVPDQPI